MLDADTVASLHRRLLAALAPIRAWADREDLVQASWVRLLECLHRYEHRSALPTFAIGVGRRVMLEESRRAALHRNAGDRWPLDAVRATMSDPASEGEALLLEERRHQFYAALESLEARDRWLLLCRSEGASYEECLPRYRARFGTGIGSVEGLRTAVFHARRRLEKVLPSSDS